MVCTIRFHGVLAIVLCVPPGEELLLDLPEKANYGTLLDTLHQRFNNRFPPSMWDGEKACFHPSVLAFGDGNRFLPENRTLPLPEGREVRFHLPLSGG